MARYRLPSVDYEPRSIPSLYDRWEEAPESAPQAPPAVHSPDYRSMLVRVFNQHRDDRRSLISVGAGNGCMEALLAATGWDVLATDCTESALARCRAKGLVAERFALMDDPAPGTFDVIYCDGLMGHLWQPSGGTAAAWKALAELAHPGSLCIMSNDLADSDKSPQFTVRASTAARFYRPPAGRFAAEAEMSEKWEVKTQSLFLYQRNDNPRRREIVVAEVTAERKGNT